MATAPGTARDTPRAPEGPEAFDRRPPLALELLVHGVGGTTPQRMLGDPRTVRLAGDERAGIHRRARDADAEEHPERQPAAPVPEAYCWSNLTSGNGTRALWLLLLPFMVANLAHWMRPPSLRTRVARGYELLVRLLALTLTVLLVAAVCEVALDIVAWQCAARPECVRGRSWLEFAAGGRGGWWSEPGRRLALGAAVPVALTTALWWLSHRTWYAYESQRPAARPAPAPGTPPLAMPGFWYGRRSVARLRTAHTAAGLLTVTTALCVPPLTRDAHRPGALPDAFGWAITAAVAALGATAVAVVWRADRSESGLDDTPDHRTTRLLLAGSPALLAAAALYGCWSRPGWRATGHLPSAQAFSALTIAQGALVAALAATAAVLHRAPPHDFEDCGVALRGMAGPAVALIGCALGGVLTGGAAQRTADWLDAGRLPRAGLPRAGAPPGALAGRLAEPAAGRPAGSPIGPPAVLTWEASVIPVILALLVLGAGALWWRLRQRELALRPDVERIYAHDAHHAARTRAISRALARAALTDAAPALVAVFCGAAFALGAGAVAGAWAGGGTPAQVAAGAPGPLPALAGASQSLGSWLVGAGVVALVTLGRRAYQDPAARRTVGILWDVGTFWPRAAHPFAPPCYAERAVPDLSWRMATWTSATGGRVVLSGHSQGSVLAAAAVWQLDPEVRGRVALLTYGSPLARLYGRWFPAHFGTARLRELHEEMHTWSNLWRRTDPIGGPVGIGTPDDPVDCGPLLDPVAYGRSARHPLPEPILGHGDFQADPAFAEQRALLLLRLPPAAAGPPARDRGRRTRAGQGSSGRSSG